MFNLLLLYPLTLSSVSVLSVTVSRLELSGYILCRHLEKIVSQKPAPYFGVFNIKIELPDVAGTGQSTRLQSLVVKTLD